MSEVAENPMMRIYDRLPHSRQFPEEWRFAGGIIALVMIPIIAYAAGAQAQAPNEVLERLLTKGGLPGAKDVALPKPTMADGLDRAGQREASARIADPNHPIEALERPLVVAPFVLKISGDDEKSGTLRRIDLWFVAYGKLDRLGDESF